MADDRPARLWGMDVVFAALCAPVVLGLVVIGESLLAAATFVGTSLLYVCRLRIRLTDECSRSIDDALIRLRPGFLAERRRRSLPAPRPATTPDRDSSAR
jgi:hypothetical protein